MSDAVRIPIAIARDAAEQLVGLLGPSCERIEVAGSIRRGMNQVKDIELVLVPRFEEVQAGLFEEVTTKQNMLLAELDRLIEGGILRKRESADGTTCWGERHQRAVFIFDRFEIPLDIFGVLPPAQWGVIMAIRTGDAEFARKMVTSEQFGGRMPKGMRVQDGALWKLTWNDAPDHVIDTPEESDFFEAIGWPDYPEPGARCFV